MGGHRSEYHAIQRAIVTSLDAKGALRPELDVDRASDILWTLNHPNMWQLLVVERGWTPEQYEQWDAAPCRCRRRRRPRVLEFDDRGTLAGCRVCAIAPKKFSPEAP